ncbi:MAG TPA: ISL3 family transposase [Polyangiales bacterium]
MQVTKILSNILGMKCVRVRGCEFEEAGLVIDVAPTTRIGRCSGCGCRVRKLYDHRSGRRWRHLDLGGMRVELRYDLRRVDCFRCRVRTELVPWAEPDSMFTRPFEHQVGYLAQCMDKTAIVGLMGIAWYTVGSIAERVVKRLSPADRLTGLRVIGVDELSYRKHHKYVTIITDHDTGKVVWAHEGKSAATLDAFFAELGKERCAQLSTVTMDLSQAYIASVKANAPQAQVVFDRFHVQKLAHDALDEVRRALVAKHTEPDQRRALKKTRFALQKNPENRSSVERRKLAQIQVKNRPLYRGMLLKDSLAAILDRRQYYVARDQLHGWLAWASRSKLAPFVRVARTIRKHLHGVLAYLNTGLSNGRSDSCFALFLTVESVERAQNRLRTVFLIRSHTPEWRL